LSLSFDGQFHLFYIVFNFVDGLIDGLYFMKFMLVFAEDAVGAQQSILSFAEDGNNTIMF